MSKTLEQIIGATRGTAFEGNLYLVGGAPRDKALGLPVTEDLDLVVDGDALALAHLLWERGLSEHHPVTYPRFGTAMVQIDGRQVELVTARAESYDAYSRKPSVRRASTRDDAFRRDFTINTLMENIHTGETLDLTGRAFADLREGVIRTPLDPVVTFRDDPLRMLRAVRFAARLDFRIEEGTWAGMVSEAGRLNLMGPESPVVSAERIRDEFTKTLLGPNPVRGLRLMKEAGLLVQFFPELDAMAGVTQNAWHLHDVWDHTLHAVAALGPEAPLEVRLGVLLHDVGKPATRTEDARGIHFYEHQFVGAEMARQALNRLKFSGDEVRHVVALVELHMRLGEARPEWNDSAVKRLIRAVHPYTEELFEVSRCDLAAMRQDIPAGDLDALRARMVELNRQTDVARIQSPLDGREIMEALGVGPGPHLKEAKEFLTNEVIEGRVAEGDRESALAALRAWWADH